MAKPDLKDVEKGKDPEGRSRMFTKVREDQGIRVFRRLDVDEMQRWIDSVTGNTKIRPEVIEGKVP